MLKRIADGRTDLVYDLIEYGYPVDSKDDHGVSVIKWCAYYGDVSAIRYLLKKGEELSSIGKNFDLNGAAFHGHWQLCQFLIENGADPNHPLSENGETPLHSASSKAHLPAQNLVMEVLLANGAEPNAKTKKNEESGSFMRDVRTRAETPLHRAAAFGGPGAIRMLIDAGAELEARDMNGDSPLGWASWHKRPAYILKMLLFGDQSIHPLAVEKSVEQEALGWEAMDVNLLGKPHV
ncbi:MAG: ankyrin repeat domain-containing protein [Acidobacteria bacterium]|nr:MAG: ankyrin repeat domain-containing protein [Acidobacteriota bacterium]REK04081.1 MAG: ankyrin repeat domain-containing protein [Acidobacteriota bacterium]REK15243.1 MAG: ankyrin repeat domain-containing protein [Acidobacteriota bacterium]REK46333.1 MAG: ankyrin repeat domain-containing protein [Acidobacteriota bacterium]